MALSGSARTGAILGVVLPFCTYLYSGQQQRLEASRQQHQAEQQQLDIAAEKDKELAVRLRETLQRWQLPELEPASAAGNRNTQLLCEFLLAEAELARQGVYGLHSLNMVVSTLDSYPPHAAEGASKLACHCRALDSTTQLEDLFSDTGPERRMPAQRRHLLAPAIRKLRKVYDNCPASSSPPIAATEPVADTATAGGAVPPGTIDTETRARLAAAMAGLCSPPAGSSAAAEKRIAAPRPVQGPSKPTTQPAAPAPLPTPAGVAEPGAEASDPAEEAAAKAARAAIERKRQLGSRNVRIYIHIRSDVQIAGASCLSEALAGFGYRMPPIQNVGLRGPTQAQARFFKQEEQPQAGYLVGDINAAAAACSDPDSALKAGLAGLKLTPLMQLKSSARPFHFELWLAPTKSDAETRK